MEIYDGNKSQESGEKQADALKVKSGSTGRVAVFSKTNLNMTWTTISKQDTESSGL